MERLADLYCKFLGVVISVFLMAMVVLVLGNVVLRYFFGSGITVSEEISRWLFVWITFLGGVIAIRRHAHLGTNALVGRLSPTGKKVCLVLGHLAMLFVCWLLFQGSLAQVRINIDVLAPSSELPVAIVYFAGIVFAVSAAVMLLLDLWLVLSGRVGEEGLVMIQESEDLGALEQSHDALRPGAR